MPPATVLSMHSLELLGTIYLFPFLVLKLSAYNKVTITSLKNIKMAVTESKGARNHDLKTNVYPYNSFGKTVRGALCQIMIPSTLASVLFGTAIPTYSCNSNFFYNYSLSQFCYISASILYLRFKCIVSC